MEINNRTPENNTELPKDIQKTINKLENKIPRINEECVNIFEKIKKDSELLPENERRNYLNLKAKEPDFQYKINSLKLLRNNIDLIIRIIYDFYKLPSKFYGLLATNNEISFAERNLINLDIIQSTLNEIKGLTDEEKTIIANLYKNWSIKIIVM